MQLNIDKTKLAVCISILALLISNCSRKTDSENQITIKINSIDSKSKQRRVNLFDTVEVRKEKFGYLTKTFPPLLCEVSRLRTRGYIPFQSFFTLLWITGVVTKSGDFAQRSAYFINKQHFAELAWRFFIKLEIPGSAFVHISTAILKKLTSKFLTWTFKQTIIRRLNKAALSRII
ncbi:hypothetical protein GJU43_22320 [Flavobacterium sp. LC2016-23]|uniref:hypothetical protein n=1 Tax=Flavobacterium sp. LC2016-23 TaxID=2666330 RepID=UPI0012B10CBA|nr:hypothetical protein [Flavobacterium sp. LC2016-23]MRX42021.1 hypothetical protein [Flavobacterium sp. LC2016-23]